MPFLPAADDDRPLACSAVLTHHWLVRRRGGEKVLEAVAGLFPAAPIYSLVLDRAGLAGSPLAGRDLRVSPARWIPGVRRHYPKLLPLLALAARATRLPPADLVLCSDAAVAKAMRPHPRSKLVCYCHSPMRYAYEPEVARAYRERLPVLVRPGWQAALVLVRQIDQAAARRVDLFIANSQHVASRIRRVYGADAAVVYPPVEIPPAPATGPREAYFLCLGHHAPYKRLDLAVEACARLGRRLVVIGEGPEADRLRARGDPHVTWLGWQPDPVVQEHLRRAAALVFPGEEDFGLVPVEAQGHGCPVVAYGLGGATETVVPGRTGVLFEPQTVEMLTEALAACEQMRFDPAELHAHAARFGQERFLRELRAVLRPLLSSPCTLDP